MTPYLYTGRRYSTATELYFNRNRYYSPQMGRFISKDPIGFSGSGNLWGYGKNNPTKYIDPYGLFEGPLTTTIAIGVETGAGGVTGAGIGAGVGAVVSIGIGGGIGVGWAMDVPTADTATTPDIGSPTNPEPDK
ncbi:MAG: RHS repeat-associated core domain-containing protein, partial [Candidatus Riflebacteria bacterium]|nr:RHS repeat-associated core domain-containing protein [Candidatus Riflebacteria bacterium]